MVAVYCALSFAHSQAKGVFEVTELKYTKMSWRLTVLSQQLANHHSQFTGLFLVMLLPFLSSSSPSFQPSPSTLLQQALKYFQPVLSCIVVIAMKDLYVQLYFSHRLFHQSIIDFVCFFRIYDRLQL